MDLEPVGRLSKDLAAAARTLSRDEARFLVDAYYSMQENRIRADGQVRALLETGEPHEVLRWLGKQSEVLENQVRRALARYAESDKLGEWCLSVRGIGPVITAGLLAHIDFNPWTCAVRAGPCSERKPCSPGCRRQPIHTVGHIWRFAGLDPTSSWSKGQKRPWNAALKTLCWKIGESFVKVSNDEDAVYGRIYRERKEYELKRNESGELGDQARSMLERKKFGRETEARKHYEAGHLPPAHIHARAKRYAVKLFLAHYHEVGYVLMHGKPPPLPYPIAHLGHVHKIEPYFTRS